MTPINKKPKENVYLNEKIVLYGNSLKNQHKTSWLRLLWMRTGFQLIRGFGLYIGYDDHRWPDAFTIKFLFFEIFIVSLK